MRPLHLTLRGFTSFKQKTTVDLAGLDRFAICGPTGAGKSSLLDGLTFALFADAPRIGAGSLLNLIALGSKSFSLVLDFQVGGRSFRVTRVRRRSGTTDDRLEREMAQDRFELVASGAEAVTKTVEDLLGVNYDHFTQAVFLPQGKFAEFLKARPGDRRQLLSELLRLLVYHRMQQCAGRDLDTLTNRKAQLERRLNEDFSGVTLEVLAELAARRDEQQRNFDETTRQLPALLERRQFLRCRRERTVELEVKRLELAASQAVHAEIDAARAEAEAAARAVGVVPLLEQAEEALQEHTRRVQVHVRAEEEYTSHARAYEIARANLDLAVAEAAAVPGLRERQQRLAEALGKVALRDQLSRQLASQEKRRNGLATEHRRQLVEAETLAERTRSLANDVERAEADLATVGYEEKQHNRLDAVRESAVRLQGDRKQLADALQRAEQAATNADIARKAAEQARVEADQAEEEKKRGEQTYALAEQALRAAEDAHRVAHLRAGLQPGRPCPVCRRDVTAVPEAEPVSELAACQAALEAAKKESNRSAMAASQKDRAWAAAKATVRDTQAGAEAEQTRAESWRAAVVQEEGLLLDRVGELLVDVPSGPVESRIAEMVRKLACLREQHRRAAERLATLQNDLALAQQQKETKDAEVTRLQHEASAVDEEIDNTETALADVRGEIQAVVGTDDPGPEVTGVETEITRLEDHLTEAERDESEARNRLSIARTRVEVCAREVAEAERRAQEAAARAVQALELSGLADPGVARAAFRTPDRLKELQARVQEHDTRLINLGSRIIELESELQGRHVAEEEAVQAEAKHEDCLNRKQATSTQIALLAQRIEQMDGLLTLAEKLRKELAEQERRHRVYYRLAQDLRSDRFQAYLLEETLTGLVQDASVHLARLSGDRYGLAFVEDRIMVVDHDNAGELRTIDTFSGGETFLASLALALALSEQVHKAVGAVHLDCLFIDEGFGSLDPETLRVASDAIHGLQVGGRMVGIITHIPALQEEFDQRMLVSKEAGTSRVRIVR